jgi:hypothetical protein
MEIRIGGGAAARFDGSRFVNLCIFAEAGAGWDCP